MKKLLPVFLLIAFIISGCSARKDMDCEDIMIRMLCYTNESSRENGNAIHTPMVANSSTVFVESFL